MTHRLVALAGPGGSGNDRLSGGRGRDRLSGGPGRDRARQ
ncbi:MAG: hypothetical protein H0V57_05120 [Thermoleophilaceae bacterium]|nr:hypothetical protein [Thermoleophilaceae bacterium]